MLHRGPALVTYSASSKLFIVFFLPRFLSRQIECTMANFCCLESCQGGLCALHQSTCCLSTLFRRDTFSGEELGASDHPKLTLLQRQICWHFTSLFLPLSKRQFVVVSCQQFPRNNTMLFIPTGHCLAHTRHGCQTFFNRKSMVQTVQKRSGLSPNRPMLAMQEDSQCPQQQVRIAGKNPLERQK